MDDAPTDDDLGTEPSWASRAALLAGPLLAVLVLVFVPTGEGPGELTGPGRATLAVLVWMAVWWLTEAVEIAVTALLPVAIFPLLGVAEVGEATAPYGSSLVFLFLGGFLLALGMQRWGLDRRIALRVLRAVGTRPSSMVGGFMLVTATLSAFVSNTATAAMMLPIALSVLALVLPDGEPGEEGKGSLEGDEGRHFALCLMLGIAYAASIGGLATIIGSPPNGIFVQFLAEQVEAPFRQEIGFARWLLVGGPLAVVFLPLTWILLTRVVYPLRISEVPGGGRLLDERYRALGPLHRAERLVLAVFAATALTWVFRPLLAAIEVVGRLPLAGLSDPGIAMAAGLVLFVLPTGDGRRVLDWETARKLPWGVLVLFGGGLSLAAAVRANGVAEWIGEGVRGLAGIPTPVLVAAVVALVIFLTELTSNTATTATLLPVLAGIAAGIGVHPLLLTLPATLAASCAFMMPVATPPNAIVFASGHVTIPEMSRAGIWLNLVAIGLVVAVLYGIAVPLLGL